MSYFLVKVNGGCGLRFIFKAAARGGMAEWLDHVVARKFVEFAEVQCVFVDAGVGAGF